MTQLEEDKKVLLEMSKRIKYHIMNAYEIGTIFTFIEQNKNMNIKHKSAINRIRKALESLYKDGKCEKFKFGRGYSYSFI